MATHRSSYYKTQSNDVLDRVNLGATSQTVEGGSVVWVVDYTHITAAPTMTVMHYDKGRYGEYHYGTAGGTPDSKPHIIFKGTANFSTYNVEIQDEDENVLYTFDSDCSSVPIYVVLRLIDGDRNTVSWELA